MYVLILIFALWNRQVSFNPIITLSLYFWQMVYVRIWGILLERFDEINESKLRGRRCMNWLERVETDYSSDLNPRWGSSINSNFQYIFLTYFPMENYLSRFLKTNQNSRFIYYYCKWINVVYLSILYHVMELNQFLVKFILQLLSSDWYWCDKQFSNSFTPQVFQTCT